MSGMVIVGGGQAGYSVANKLRLLGYNGSIQIVCAENSLPYQRPPLSKKYLLGEIPKDRLYFRPENFYEANNIVLKVGIRVTEIDRLSNRVYCSDGTEILYEKLFLTTGALPKCFPDGLGGGLTKNFYIRSLDDIKNLDREFKPGKRALIIGGGYIGLEIAAAARKKNLDVTLIEAEDRILKRVACLETANFFKNLHRKNGVKIIEGETIKCLIGKKGTFSGAVLENGKEISADFSVIGIGAKPCINLAKASGLDVENGIKVDSFCQTSDNNILAAGDCANFPNGLSRLRLESVGNAIEQAECAAMTALGYREAYQAKPWFWSDQYDTKLQIAGLSSGYDRVLERRNEQSLSIWYFNDKNLIAVDSINDGKAYMVAKKLIALQRTPEEASILDLKLDLKSLLKSN